jgi:sortase (surface protein transpeptidase)
MSFWEVIKLIPQILGAIKSLLVFINDEKLKANKAKNEQIQKEVESATTPEQKQKAVNDAASKLGSN